MYRVAPFFLTHTYVIQLANQLASSFAGLRAASELDSVMEFSLYCTYLRFWATVCKTDKLFAVCYRTVHRCAVCLSCLSVTLVHCGQTIGWIKMKLGM